MVFGYIVLAFALWGLAAVVAEIFMKSPSAFAEIATDVEGFARSPVATERPAAVEPANDSEERLAA